MSNRIVSPVDEVVSDPLTMIDRLDHLSAVLAEFSDTLDGSGRFFLFDLIRSEFATLKSDISIYVRMIDHE